RIPGAVQYPICRRGPRADRRCDRAARQPPRAHSRAFPHDLEARATPAQEAWDFPHVRIVMFTKVLVANRGEIAVRIMRTCRDMGIATVALYEASDRGSLHVRLADECVQLRSDLGYMDQQEVLRVARATGAQAIHPGYGFLAERPEFIAACQAAGIAF